MRNENIKRVSTDILYEIAGNFLIAFGTYNIAANSDFAISGFSGIALILYRLFELPMGSVIFVLNIPLALLCIKYIGLRFIAKSVRCIAIQSLIMDFVVVLLPSLSFDPMIAALSVGSLYGIGFAMIYMRGSSTGGLDFPILLIKHFKPHIKTGMISFCLDFVTLVMYGVIFKDFEAVVYGIIIVFVSATVIDRIILGMNQGAVAYIVTAHGNGEKVYKEIDAITQRGGTILEGRGGFNGEKKDVVMIAGSAKDIYNVQRMLKEKEPDSFVIVLDSKEVQGEGFEITRVAGE